MGGRRAAGGLIDDAFGIVWQWTRSAYSPYPGYRAAAGALGEYNGKFMVNQMVLRGSSHATPSGHARVELPQFLPAVGTLAIQRRPSGRISGSELQRSIRPLRLCGARGSAINQWSWS